MVGPRNRRNTGGAPTNNSDIPVPTLAVSQAPTPALAQTSIPTEALAPVQALTPTSTPASVSGLSERYTDEDLQRVTKLALKSFIKG